MSWSGSDTGCLFDADYLKIASEREGHNKITEMMCPGDENRADMSVVALPKTQCYKMGRTYSATAIQAPALRPFA